MAAATPTLPVMQQFGMCTEAFKYTMVSSLVMTFFCPSPDMPKAQGHSHKIEPELLLLTRIGGRLGFDLLA